MHAIKDEAMRDGRTGSSDQTAALRKELEAVPKPERLDYLANLPRDRQASFKRILSPEELKKLNEHIDRLVRQRSKPTYETWIAEARAGRASSTDAMIEVLREENHRLRPQDALWISRISETASAGSYSRRQQEVIGAIYDRYFGSQTRS
jgi:hypothetical protein